MSASSFFLLHCCMTVLKDEVVVAFGKSNVSEGIFDVVTNSGVCVFRVKCRKKMAAITKCGQPTIHSELWAVCRTDRLFK
jgi:hypothetical protein